MAAVGNYVPIETKYDLGAKLVKQANDSDKMAADIVQKAAETPKTEPVKGATEPGVGGKLDISV